MLKKFCLELGEAGAVTWFDIFNLDISDEGSALQWLN